MIVKKDNIITGLAWLYNLALIVICLAPIGDHVPQPFTRSDLMYHGLAYMLAFLFYIRAYPLSPKVIIIGFSLQGIIIEFIQPYFGRFFELYDIAANMLGVLMGFFIYKVFNKLSPKKSTGPLK